MFSTQSRFPSSRQLRPRRKVSPIGQRLLHQSVAQTQMPIPNNTNHKHDHDHDHDHKHDDGHDGIALTVDGQDLSLSWECSKCTLINPNDLYECDACSNAKPAPPCAACLENVSTVKLNCCMQHQPELCYQCCSMILHSEIVKSKKIRVPCPMGCKHLYDVQGLRRLVRDHPKLDKTLIIQMLNNLRNAESSQRDIDEDPRLALWAAQQGDRVKSCPACSQMIEKNEGCDHMNCSR